jgi:hypothetical protein
VTAFATFVQPGWLAALLVWNFLIMSAAQLTIRLILAFSIPLTLLAAVVLTVLALPIAAVWDIVAGNGASLAARLELAPLPMLLMAIAGFGVARWVLKIRRLRGQLIAGLMVGILDPHLFTLLSS